ncbi:MAG: methyltransferase [Candidatus Diapherotrites archaeon]|nr:methyltransferase [Candidatus Diapherotrites archaeon]
MRKKLPIPRITRAFMKDIESNAAKGVYRISSNRISIDVFPFVFPPESSFSNSSRSLFLTIRNLSGKTVLDIGTGTGILAIKAALAGARLVEAVDISAEAVKCARHNVKLNGLSKKIRVFQSDLFSKVPKSRKYDLIIANPPIVDYSGGDSRFFSLLDPNFSFHDRLFSNACKYLVPEGSMLLCHANLQKKSSFKRLERLALQNCWNFKIVERQDSLGFEWRIYNFFQALKVKAGLND